MAIRVQCPTCTTKHNVADRMAGRQVRCPSCDAQLQIPSLEEIEAARAQRAAEKRRAALAAMPVAEPLDTGEGGAIAVDSEPPPLEEDEPLVLNTRKEDPEMDMTPMVDVTFLLLIFFMVTAAFQLQKSIIVPNEKSDDPSTMAQEDEEPPPFVTVQIDEYNAYFVLAEDWEKEVPGKQNLINTLREARNSVVGEPPSRLVIEAHVDSLWKAVVDAMDAGAETDFSEMEITDVEEFD